jgi:hypothetical protein
VFGCGYAALGDVLMGRDTKYVVVFKRGPTLDEEEREWDLQAYPIPDTVNLGMFVADIRREVDVNPLWAVLLCRTCREQVKNGGSWISPCL